MLLIEKNCRKFNKFILKIIKFIDIIHQFVSIRVRKSPIVQRFIKEDSGSSDSAVLGHLLILLLSSAEAYGVERKCLKQFSG